MLRGRRESWHKSRAAGNDRGSVPSELLVLLRSIAISNIATNHFKDADAEAVELGAAPAVPPPELDFFPFP